MQLAKKYSKIWLLTASNAWQETFVNRGTNALFMVGKVIRLAMTLLFLFLVKQNVANFAGYTSDQIIVFFLTYQFVDVLAQVFYRGVYIFREKIRTGEFDFYLLKPVNALFQSLTGRPDINDSLFIIPTTVASIYIASQLQLTITVSSVLLFLILMANAFLIATALHIVVLVIGILTTEVDGVIWLYRDLMQLGRFPVSMYLEPLRFILFFLVPIGMMITIPAEVLLNLNPSYGVGLALLIGIGSVVASLQLWQWSLKHYASASS